MPREAYLIRLQKLFGASLVDKAILLFTTGSEVPGDIQSTDLKLQDKDVLCVGQEVLIWLVEILEDAVLEVDKEGT